MSLTSLMRSQCHPRVSMRETAHLERSAGGVLLPRWSWSSHLLRGRPGQRLQRWSGGRPSDRSMWHHKAWWAGVPSTSLATWLKTRVPVAGDCLRHRAETTRELTSTTRMWSCQWILVIWHWHFTWKASKRFVSAASGVHISQAMLGQAIQLSGTLGSWLAERGINRSRFVAKMT